MGLGPLNDTDHPFWQHVASFPSAAGEWIVGIADKLVPYGPVLTPTVAIVAGCIALYSVHVTRTIARKRATIDFFLKTEADKSILELFQNFINHVSVVDKHIDEGKSLTDVTATAEYKTVHACLNMHELIAVGIEQGVFDKTVAYGFWSGALVGHCAAAKKVIDFSRSDPSDLSAYISLIDLNARWRKRLDRWAKAQPNRPRRRVVVPGPVILHFGDPEV